MSSGAPLAVLPLSLFVAPAMGQSATSSACNNMNRDSIASAGYYNSLSETCTVVTIGGVSSPSSCLIGYAHNSQNIYRCEGELPDWHCAPTGYSATVTVATDGGCPGLPDFSDVDFSLTGLVNIPVALIRSFTCAPPKKSSTEDPSAKITECAGGNQVSPYSQGEVIQSSSGATATWWSTQTAAATTGIQGTFNLFLTAYDQAQTGTPAELGGTLGAVAASQQGLHGTTVNGTVEVAHWDAGATEPSAIYSEQIAGSITLDGRFDCTRIIEGKSQGDPTQITHRTTFDGLHLRDHSAAGEAGNVYEMDAGTNSSIAELYAGSIAHLYAWLYDPYVIPLFPGGVTLEEISTSQGTVVLRRHHPLLSGGTFVGTEYDVVLRNGVALPIRRTEFDAAGNVWAEFSCADFFELRQGDWRPGTIVFSRYLDGQPNARKITVTTRVVRASALTEEPETGIPLPWADNLNWQVWQ